MPEISSQMQRARELAGSSGAWFFFDGSAAPEGEARRSYLGAASEVVTAELGQEQEFLERLRSTSLAQGKSRSGVRSGFTSGWVVALSYEFGLGLLGIKTRSAGAKPQEAGLPTAFALRVNRVEHMYEAYPAEETSFAVPRGFQMQDPQHNRVSAGWRRDRSAYERNVEECQAAIHRGDAYVLCLTDTAEATVRAPYDPVDLFTRLRAGGTATRGGVIEVRDRALVSASPERFLSVTDGLVTTHPIKGTRGRGSTPLDDRRLAEELAADPKERAENLMIVDLMRNDLSRVCDSETVRVTRFLDVETHPRVHQLVSTIEGKLRADHDVYDAIAACFPGGSMTGAPKLRAAEILAELEGGERGLYSGCFGWIDDSGDAELAMTIRSVELRGAMRPGDTGEVTLLVGAGGGITSDSVPKSEWQERELKAHALLSAL